MGRKMMDGKRMHSIQWSSNCLSSAVNRALSGSGQTVHLVSVSINESSSVIFFLPSSSFCAQQQIIRMRNVKVFTSYLKTAWYRIQEGAKGLLPTIVATES